MYYNILLIDDHATDYDNELYCEGYNYCNNKTTYDILNENENGLYLVLIYHIIYIYIYSL